MTFVSWYQALLPLNRSSLACGKGHGLQAITTLDDEVGRAADNIMPSEDKPQDHSFDNGCIVKSSSTGGFVPVERGSEVTTGPIVSLSERGTSPVLSLQDTGTSTGPIMVDTGISTLPEMKEVATTTSETEFKLLEEPKPTITDMIQWL